MAIARALRLVLRPPLTRSHYYCSGTVKLVAVQPHRTFHVSSFQRVNPLLPFDAVESMENEELKEEKEHLEKEKKSLKKKAKVNAKQKQVVQTQVQADPILKPATSGGNSNSNNGLNNENQNSASRKKKEEEDDGPEDPEDPEEDDNEETPAQRRRRQWQERRKRVLSLLHKCFETAAITFASVAILAAAGLTYHRAYDAHVLDKMETAFEVGDASFDLAIHERASNDGENWVSRPEQQLMDDVVSGKIKGRYFLLIGEKGTGKNSLVMESFSKVNGLNCTALDAHADPEIFRIRLGKALNFEFFEDYIGSLFSIRGPRDTTAILDIERAFSKLEEVAIKRVRKTKKPLVLFINSAHLIRDNDEGISLVELLQQKAEELCGAGLVTMIFNSDDYWLYERMKKLGTKLEVISVSDLNREQAVRTLKTSRRRFFNEGLDDKVADRVYDLIGGRPQHLSQVAKHRNMIVACHQIIDREKTWFLNQCGLLGEGMDDDVMESGKFLTSAMLLAKEFVEADKQRIKELHDAENHKLPLLPLWRARQVMTRPDYIQRYDDLNIFTIDCLSNVRADSVPMMRAFHEICSQPGFDELLEQTCDRVSAIESLGRTRELVAKDLVLGGHYKLKTSVRDNHSNGRSPYSRGYSHDYARGPERDQHYRNGMSNSGVSDYQKLVQDEYRRNYTEEKVSSEPPRAGTEQPAPRLQSQTPSQESQSQEHRTPQASQEYTTKITLHGGTREDGNGGESKEDSNGDSESGPFNDTIPLQDLREGANRYWWEKRMKDNYATTFLSPDSTKQEIDVREDITTEDGLS